jgi:CheY-like chemotaxis protein
MTEKQVRSRVLVVDDAAYNREILIQNLEDDYELLEAADGLTGFCLARDQRPDIVLLDVRLPGIDGCEVARRLRREPGIGWVPIVAVTADAMSGARERALASGCDDYLAKPVDERLLLTKVREWIERGKQRR